MPADTGGSGGVAGEQVGVDHGVALPAVGRLVVVGAGDQTKLGASRVAVHVEGRELLLGNVLGAVDFEHRHDAVGSGDVDLAALSELVEAVEDPDRALGGVHVAKDDRRAELPGGGRVAIPPGWRAGLDRRNFERAITEKPELDEVRVQAERRDVQGDRC